MKRSFIFAINILLLSVFCIQAADYETESVRIPTQEGGRSNTVNCLLQDEKGYLWLGTAQGLYRHDGYATLPILSLPSSITGLAEDREHHHLWVFPEQEDPVCLNLETYKPVNYSGKKKAPVPLNRFHRGKLHSWLYGDSARCLRLRFTSHSFHTEVYDRHILDIQSDNEGNDWILTDKGLYLNGLEEQLPRSEGAVCMGIYHNLCLILTAREIRIYNPSRRIIREIPYPDSFHSPLTLSDCLFRQDNLMIFTDSKTYTYNIIDNSFATPSGWQIPQGKVLPESTPAVAYISNENGQLMRIDSKGESRQWQLMDEKNLPRTSYPLFHVAAISPTTEAVSTFGNGLFLHNTSTGELTHCKASDKESPVRNDSITALLADHNGSLWIAEGEKGLTHLLTEASSSQQMTVGKVCLTSINGETSVLSQAKELPQEYLRLTFSTLQYAGLRSILYQYYLEGIEQDWNQPTESPVATYHHLEAGDYIFHVRAATKDGQWGEETTYTLTVRQVWWKSPLLPAAGILLLLAAIGWGAFRLMHSTTPPVPQAEEPDTSPQDSLFIKRMEHVMEKEMHRTDFTVEELARHMNLGRTRLYARTKEAAGVTPAELLRKARLERAAKLLLESEESIDEIRKQCGIGSPTNFYNYFKKQFNRTPSQYRKHGGRAG